MAVVRDGPIGVIAGGEDAELCGPVDGSQPAAFVATVGEPGVTDLGPASHFDWARTLEPIGAD